MSKIYNFKPLDIITALDNNLRFQEALPINVAKYENDINEFKTLVLNSSSSEELLDKIRQRNIHKDKRMTFLKLFRRCVSTVIDTETSKKISKISTQSLIDAYSATFANINDLKKFFRSLTEAEIQTLSCLLAEYDTRGLSGYELTTLFFSWFKNNFADFEIKGPIAAGRDIELSSILSDFDDLNFPCDFIIYHQNKLVAVGFSRYDSTRGGAQSDDRTGGNALKVAKLKNYQMKTNNIIKVIFLSDGPGLAHNDTWQENCRLADSWGDNARVTTMKIANIIITREWLLS